jgi:hypothetical protein
MDPNAGPPLPKWMEIFWPWRKAATPAGGITYPPLPTPSVPGPGVPGTPPVSPAPITTAPTTISRDVIDAATATGLSTDAIEEFMTTTGVSAKDAATAILANRKVVAGQGASLTQTELDALRKALPGSADAALAQSLGDSVLKAATAYLQNNPGFYPNLTFAERAALLKQQGLLTIVAVPGVTNVPQPPPAAYLPQPAPAPVPVVVLPGIITEETPAPLPPDVIIYEPPGGGVMYVDPGSGFVYDPNTGIYY